MRVAGLARRSKEEDANMWRLDEAASSWLSNHVEIQEHFRLILMEQEWIRALLERK